MIKKLLIIFLIFSFSKDIFSQEINLKIKAGEFIVKKDFNLDISADDNYRLIFFDQIPTNHDQTFSTHFNVANWQRSHKKQDPSELFVKN